MSAVTPELKLGPTLLTPLSAIYGTVAGWRRAWYSADPSRRRRLARPVISVGNLRAGGAGKTPVVLALARLLASRGERPAILLRGYARQVASDGVTVVSDGSRIVADFAHAGDEALMLARQLPSCPVLVCADRYLAGCLAERRFGATLHVLDDGFQHLQLARDIDLLIVDAEDLSDRLLPAGRLREPIDVAASADALLTPSAAETVAEWRRRVQAPVFRLTRTPGAVRSIGPGQDLAPFKGAPAFAVAGIARPQRFLDDLTSAGWTLAGHATFRDHHAFTAADLRGIVASAKAAGARIVLTTEKDAVRLEHLLPAELPFASVGLDVGIDPRFVDWLIERLERRGTKNADVGA